MGALLGQFCEVDEAAVGGGEPSGIHIEGSQVVVEVDMEPLASCSCSLVAGDGDETDPDASISGSWGHHLVLEPCVDESIPDHVHEPHQ